MLNDFAYRVSRNKLNETFSLQFLLFGSYYPAFV